VCTLRRTVPMDTSSTSHSGEGAVAVAGMQRCSGLKVSRRIGRAVAWWWWWLVVLKVLDGQPREDESKGKWLFQVCGVGVLCAHPTQCGG
jgi:hypothetical protein